MKTNINLLKVKLMIKFLRALDNAVSENTVGPWSFIPCMINKDEKPQMCVWFEEVWPIIKKDMDCQIHPKKYLRSQSYSLKQGNAILIVREDWEQYVSRGYNECDCGQCWLSESWEKVKNDFRGAIQTIKPEQKCVKDSFKQKNCLKFDLYKLKMALEDAGCKEKFSILQDHPLKCV